MYLYLYLAHAHAVIFVIKNFSYIHVTVISTMNFIYK